MGQGGGGSSTDKSTWGGAAVGCMGWGGGVHGVGWGGAVVVCMEWGAWGGGGVGRGRVGRDGSGVGRDGGGSSTGGVHGVRWGSGGMPLDWPCSRVYTSKYSKPTGRVSCIPACRQAPPVGL